MNSFSNQTLFSKWAILSLIILSLGVVAQKVLIPNEFKSLILTILKLSNLLTPLNFEVNKRTNKCCSPIFIAR